MKGQWKKKLDWTKTKTKNTNYKERLEKQHTNLQKQVNNKTKSNTQTYNEQPTQPNNESYKHN